MGELLFFVLVVAGAIHALMICDTIRSSTDMIVRAIERNSKEVGQ